MQRVQRLLDKRIIREVTPIFDTRALGYSSMLVAAKVDPDNPHRAAQVHQLAPGRHAQLPAQPRLQPVVHARRRAGLEARARRHARRDGRARPARESIRQLPTLKLFKIRMDLEMEDGHRRARHRRRGGRAARARPDRALRRGRRDDPRHPGPDAGDRASPTRPAAERLGVARREVLARLESLRERDGLRRVAAILFHRRAGFSANGMGVWEVPEAEILDTGRRMAAFRGISHCYQRPTYADWPYSVFTMAHGRSKEECDAVLDAIAEQTGITGRATLYSSTEFKKVRMLYFTDDFRAGSGARTR